MKTSATVSIRRYPMLSVMSYHCHGNRWVFKKWTYLAISTITIESLRKNRGNSWFTHPCSSSVILTVMSSPGWNSHSVCLSKVIFHLHDFLFSVKNENNSKPKRFTLKQEKTFDHFFPLSIDLYTYVSMLFLRVPPDNDKLLIMI